MLKHFFFIANEEAKEASVYLCPVLANKAGILLKRLARDKHSSIFGQCASDKEISII